MVRGIFRLLASTKIARLTRNLNLGLASTLANSIGLLTRLFRHTKTTVLRARTRTGRLHLPLNRKRRRLLRLLLRRNVKDNIHQNKDIIVKSRVTRVTILLLASKNLRERQLLNSPRGFPRLIRERNRLLNSLLNNKLVAIFVRRLTKRLLRLISDLRRVRKSTSNTNLINSDANSNLTGPPNNVNQRFRTLNMVGLLRHFGRARIAFLSRVRRLRATTRVTLNSTRRRARINLKRALLYLIITNSSTRNRDHLLLKHGRQRATGLFRVRLRQIIGRRLLNKDHLLQFLQLKNFRNRVRVLRHSVDGVVRRLSIINLRNLVRLIRLLQIRIGRLRDVRSFLDHRLALLTARLR